MSAISNYWDWLVSSFDYVNQPWIDTISKLKYGTFPDPLVVPGPSAPQTREEMTKGNWTWDELIRADQAKWSDWKVNAIPEPDTSSTNWIPAIAVGIGIILLLKE